jgi:hypothetical protein
MESVRSTANGQEFYREEKDDPRLNLFSFIPCDIVFESYSLEQSRRFVMYRWLRYTRCFIRVIFSVSNSIEEKKMKQTFVLLKTKRQLSLLFRPRIDNGWG